MSWKKEGYVVLKNAIPKELRQVLAIQFRMFRDNCLYFDKDKFARNDYQITNSFSHYGFYAFEALLDSYLKDRIEKEIGIELYPTYSYARIYYNKAEMAIHTDRPSCQYSATCCIDSDGTPWPIGFINRKGEKVYIYQEPGDVVVYSGCELEHWRNSYEGEEQIQCFLHYVDAKGEFREFIYDKRDMLGLPAIIE